MRSLLLTLLLVLAFLCIVPTVHAQTAVCTYVEQNGAVKNCVGVTAVGPSGSPGAIDVEGNVADGAVDTGNSVKMGAVATAAGIQPALTAGNRAPLTLDTRGNLRIVMSGSGNPGAPVATGTTVGLIAGGVNTSVLNPLAVVNYGWNGTNTIPLASDTSGYQSVITRGAPTLTTAQVSVGTTSTSLKAATPTRSSITITTTGTIQCYIGVSGVTSATGFPLAPLANTSITLRTSAAVFAVCASTATLAFIEES